MTATIIDLDEEGRKRNLPLPRPCPVIDEDWDDVPVMDRALLWGPEHKTPGPLTLFFISQSDPGDEI